MHTRQLIEANIAFLRRSTFQGTELEAFVAVMNALNSDLQAAMIAEQAALSPLPGKTNGASHPEAAEAAAPAE